MTKPRASILVVDDNLEMVTTLADVLALKGYQIYTACSGKAAMEVLAQHRVHILLTDVIMPDMSGVELFRESQKQYPNLITFLMTAYAADHIIQQAVAEGVKTVLTKPLKINLLLDLIAAVEHAYIRKI